MTKKILLSTITDYNNYGNRLQNYALQEVLKSYGYDVETLVNHHTPVGKLSKATHFLTNHTLKQMIGLTVRSLRPYYKGFFRGKTVPNMDSLNEARKNQFLKFTHDNITETDYKVYPNKLEKISVDSYDFFVTGSDQVWNPHFRFGSPIDFLRFAPEEKRIAYAPSIGINELPLKYKGKYSMWLKEIQSLSVREEAGKQIIKELTGKNVPILVDPTLLLSYDQWMKVTKPSFTKPKEKYLVTYFLGGFSDEQEAYMNDLAKKHHLKIVHLSKPEYEEYYTAGPSEFLDYIHSSEIFLTNSFHGVVFSILFKKPFIIFKRGNMNSRIDTLLTKFGLENRKAENMAIENIFEIDYSHVPEILNEEREKSLSYLKKSLA